MLSLSSFSMLNTDGDFAPMMLRLLTGETRGAGANPVAWDAHPASDNSLKYLIVLLAVCLLIVAIRARRLERSAIALERKWICRYVQWILMSDSFRIEADGS